MNTAAAEPIGTTGPTIVMGREGDALHVTPDLICLRMIMVNCYFVGSPAERWWVLVDTGLPGSLERIAALAERQFGPRAQPCCIVLTHGHFDHVGDIVKLVEKWNVFVYAHELELPYLTGVSQYPPPDPTVGGGMVAQMSRLFPRRPVDLGNRVRPLPADGTIPGMPGWTWVHTPGHTPGHVSLFRTADRMLIAGDAITTRKPESLTALLTEHQRVHGPPAYYTQDWEAARLSVQKLAALRPSLAATGHGLPMYGPRLMRELDDLAVNFNERALPRHGRYLYQPAIADRTGVVSVPPEPVTVLPGLLGAVAIAAGVLLGGKLLQRYRHRRRPPL